MDKTKNYLVTGSSGFIGFYLCKYLLDNGCKVIGIDNMNDYYDVKLKEERLNILKKYDDYVFYQKDISEKDIVLEIFKNHKHSYILNI